MVSANYRAVLDDYADDGEVFASFQGLSWEEAHAPLHREQDPLNNNGDCKKRRRFRDSLPIQTVEEKWHAAKVWWHYRSEWPQRSAVHRGFVMLNVLSVASCFRMIMAQLMPLILRASVVSALEIFLRIYISIYCAIFIIAELEVRIPVIWKTNDGFLHSFLPRGLSFTFIALVGVFMGIFDERIENYKHLKERPDSLPGPGLFLALLVQLSSIMLMVAGMIYILLGLWCCPHMQKKRDECREQYQFEVSRFLRRMKDEKVILQKGEASRRRSASTDFGENAVGATLS